MRKILFVALAALPLAALAQGPGPGPNARGKGQPGNPEMAIKKMRLARALGLAEVLDLDAPQALKLSEQLSKLDERRLALRQQMHDAHDVLRRAAQGEKVPAAEVDQAIQRALDARAQMQGLDRDTVGIVTQGLGPEKKARAVLFLARFHGRFGRGPGMGPGMMGPGGPRGRGMGPGGWGPGGTGPGQGPTGMGPGGMGPMGMGPMGMNDEMGPPGDPWDGPDDE